MSISDPPPAAPPPVAPPAPAVPADAHIELVATLASIELSVIGADFTPVASAVGRLTATVPAGIYQIVARAGPVIQRRLITVGPGETYQDYRIEVRFPAPAPVNDTTTTHEYHESAVERASGMVTQMPGPPSGLVLIVRDVRGTDGPALEPAELLCFSLSDSALNPVPGFEVTWQIEPGAAIATWSGRLAPGGYALRTDPTRIPAGVRSPASSQASDQSIWLSEGWQTIVFITTGSAGPQTTAASIHMGQLGIGWTPYDTDVALALELANYGLREGRSVVPDDLVGVLLNGKFINPMLGIVGAHSLLLRTVVDWNVVDTVLHNLEQMVPGHPDVIALRWMAARGRAADGQPVGPTGLPAGAPGQPPPPVINEPAGGATWPPMLLPSYRALIAMDALDSNAIADGSPAERAAANLLVQGIWTNWMPLAAVPPIAAGDAAPPGEAVNQIATPALLASIGNDPGLLANVELADPATTRVASYLSALAVLEGDSGRKGRFETLTPQEIALATTLPVATVDRSLGSIGVALAPILGAAALGGGGGGASGGGGGGGAAAAGGGGGGLSTGVIAAFAAVVLLLGGAVGVTAWCAGGNGCPLFSVQPTDPPTAPPTEPPTPEPTPTPIVTPSPTLEVTAPPTESPTPTPTPTPTPVLLNVPAVLDFEVGTIGAPAIERQLFVTALDPVDFRVDLLDDAGGIFTMGEPCKWRPQIAEGWICATSFQFSPREVLSYVGSAQVVAADDPTPHPVQLQGQGQPIILTIDPRSVEFGTDYIESSGDQVPVVNHVFILAKEAAHLDFVVDDAAGVFQPTVPGCDLVLDESAYYRCFLDVTLVANGAAEYFGAIGVFTNGTQVDRIDLHGYGNYTPD